MLEVNNLYCGDCLELMKEIPDGSIDMALADPPYGVTACIWDSLIPLDPMWKELRRIAKPNGAILMTASQPFTSILIASNMEMFKYCWIWVKNRKTGNLNARKRPMSGHEEVAVFYRGQPTYNRQMGRRTKRPRVRVRKNIESSIYGKQKEYISVEPDGINPNTVLLGIKAVHSSALLHEAQKPVALMEYMINTYTNAGEIVLDFCIGSGTTAVACIKTRRQYIGIELDEGYVQIAEKRIAEELAQFRFDWYS